MDAVANTQECLYTMSTNNIEAAIMKIDLQKDFDCLDWGFIECLLEKIGLRACAIRWIMACVENVNYAVIINGIPSRFFQAERGLRQGCPLSPLLFILAMNSLSIHINNAVADNRCMPINICRQVYISHNLFIEDVLLITMLCRLSWTCLKNILDRFQKATGIYINKGKSSLYHNGANLEMVKSISELFGIESRPINEGLKYLGFHLKAKGYSKLDWQWLTARYYKKIATWEHRSLSLAGRVILS